MAHFNLGNALGRQGQDEEAAACYRRAIALDAKTSMFHYNLGNLLGRDGPSDEAVACYRRAIALDPEHAAAHCNLGRALRQGGQFAESLAAYRRGHELGAKLPGWPYPSAEWVRQAERLADLELRLPAYLKGEVQPRDTEERLALALACQIKKFHHAAARLYADAFAAEPKAGGDLGAGHRYIAACSAALAASGQGQDSAGLEGPAKAKLRAQALGWIKADLAAWARLLESAPPQAQSVARALRRWQQDSGLASVRDRSALDELPAEEQEAFARLWADVAALLEEAEEKK